MTVQLLSPHEIAAFLQDSGLIDKAAAGRLETRIAAYGDSREINGHKAGVVMAARKAAAVAGSLKGANQRAAAEKVWRAIEMLLPHSREAEQAYARGFKDGAEHRSKRQRQGPRSDSKMS
jgi:hypothetical protein